MKYSLSSKTINELKKLAECKFKSHDFEVEPYWMKSHPGQVEAWSKDKRRLIITAGWQSGKTDFLVQWILRQFGRSGPGDAFVCAPTFPLLSAALQPRLVASVNKYALGYEKKAANQIIIPYDSLVRCGWKGEEVADLTIYLRHTSEVKSVEAITALWIAADEAGQMSNEVGEALEGRTSATGGQMCLISRPYFDNWFTRLSRFPDSVTDTVSFASWLNPGWRRDLRHDEKLLDEEIERLKNSMPAWRFLMKFGGEFTKPAGLILDNWDESMCFEPFLIPSTWKRYTFHDFGSVHAFVISVAEHPTEVDADGYPVLYVYRETFPNKATATWQIVKTVKDADLRDFEEYEKETNIASPAWAPRGIGGAASENNWRFEYASVGLSIESPMITDVGTQIDRLYATIGRGGLRISSSCIHLLQMMNNWAYEIDATGEPIPGKIDKDANFHGPAALRYGVSQLRPSVREIEESDDPLIGSVGWYMKNSGIKYD